MEKQKLPYATTILVLGIFSILTFCCIGITGLPAAIIALILVNKSIKKYKEEPELYDNYNQIRAGKIVAIIGLIINIIIIARFLYVLSDIGIDGFIEIYNEALEKSQ